MGHSTAQLARAELELSSLSAGGCSGVDAD